jgi:hypothetical protein
MSWYREFSFCKYCRMPGAMSWYSLWPSCDCNGSDLHEEEIWAQLLIWQKRKKNAQGYCDLLIMNNCCFDCVTSFSPVWVQWVSKRELHSRITPLSHAVLFQGQEQHQSYTDSPRVRDKSRGWRQSMMIAHKAIKFTAWSTIRGSNTSCFHYYM